MRTHDILLTIKAIELLTKGANIDSLKDEATVKNSYFNKDNKLISRLSDNVEDFYCVLTDDLRQFLGLHGTQVLRRTGKCFYGVIEEAIPEGAAVLKDVSKEIFLSTVQQLYKRGVCLYPDLLKCDKDPDYLETVKQQDANYKPDTVPEDFVSKLSKDNTDFFLKILLATCYSNTREVMEKLYEYNNAEKNWGDLKRAFPNSQIIDDRLYVPVLPSSRMVLETAFSPNALDECDYIVVSKNVYDYFFCSYGSAHQSCYSLNSTHKGFFGMIPMILSDNHYMIYGTKSHAQAVTVGGTDKKYPAPYMFFRSWGWMSNDGVLLIDKIYTSVTETKYVDHFLTKNGFSIPQMSERILLKEPDKYSDIFTKYELRFYPDSMRPDWKHFSRGDGIRSFIGSIPLVFPVRNCDTVIGALSTFTVDKNLDIYKDITVIDGRMFNPKHCPITNLIINDTEDAHWLSTIVKKPVKNLMMLEWNDGLYRINITNNLNRIRTDHFFFIPECDYSNSQYDDGNHTFLFTPDFSRKNVPLQKIKTWIQNYKSELENDIDMIVLKVVDKNQLNFIKYSTGK